jgi:hypothetical protein
VGHPPGDRPAAVKCAGFSGLSNRPGEESITSRRMCRVTVTPCLSSHTLYSKQLSKLSPEHSARADPSIVSCAL